MGRADRWVVEVSRGGGPWEEFAVAAWEGGCGGRWRPMGRDEATREAAAWASRCGGPGTSYRAAARRPLGRAEAA